MSGLTLSAIPEDVRALHERAQGLGLEIRAKHEQLSRLLHDLQRRCNHALIAEAPYRPSGIFNNAEPPVRVCEVCGLTDEGWGVGFKHLAGERVRAVSRDALWRLRSDLLLGTRVGIDPEDRPPLEIIT